MQPETYRMTAAREGSYWWSRARRLMAVALLRRHGLAPGGKWLDIGCGPGGNLSMLDEFRPRIVVGVDLSPVALDLARSTEPYASLVRADINRGLPFVDGAFDIATIFNVVYHAWIESEAAVLAEAFRVVRPGGLMLITEPAFASLLREMDVKAMTRRRYRRSTFADMCRAAGLEVLFTSYFTSFGYPLLLALKALHRLRAKVRRSESRPMPDMKPISSLLNACLYGVAALEARLIGRKVAMPFGTTLVCVARRPAMEHDRGRSR
jgi:SAM-dependent methyltransferase